jgi:hypothetical protein
VGTREPFVLEIVDLLKEPYPLGALRDAGAEGLDEEMLERPLLARCELEESPALTMLRGRIPLSPDARGIGLGL